MKLNIYGKGGKIIKTYEAESFRLKTGLCLDILEEIDIDRLTSGVLDETKLGFEIIKIVAKNFPKFEPMMIDIFDGLTSDEFRNTSIDEVGQVVIEIVIFTINKLSDIKGSKKN